MDVSGSEPTRGAGRVPAKAEWRTRLLAQRAAVAPPVHHREALALATAARELAASLDGETVCCYLPFGSEPGSRQLVDAVAEAGARVLLPVIPDAPGPLAWAAYEGANSLVSGPIRGLLEPSGPRLPPDAIAAAALVLVPALAVDASGVRLGRGAGYYDRTLPLAAPGARLIAVVRDEELVPQLPAEEHDVRMTGVMMPSAGLRALPLYDMR